MPELLLNTNDSSESRPVDVNKMTKEEAELYVKAMQKKYGHSESFSSELPPLGDSRRLLNEGTGI